MSESPYTASARPQKAKRGERRGKAPKRAFCSWNEGKQRTRRPHILARTMLNGKDDPNP